MTPAQLATLKAAILADPALSPLSSGPTTDYNGLVTLLNAAASPTTKAWRTSVPPVDADDAPDYSTFDSIPAGKRDSWGFFLAFTRDYNRNKTRKWVIDVWGNATAGSNAEAVLTTGLENATRAQVIIGGTQKTTGTVSGLDRYFTGVVTADMVVGMFNV